MYKLFFKLAYSVIILIRIFIFPLFLTQPLLAWLITFVLDAFDYSFALRSGARYITYQMIDKVLDLLFVFYMVLAVWYTNYQLLWLFVAYFVLRIIGSIFFEVTKNSKYLIYYPNLLEFFFPLYIISQTVFANDTTFITISFVVAYFAKMVQEEVAHNRYYLDPVSLAYIKKHPEHQRDISRYIK